MRLLRESPSSLVYPSTNQAQGEYTRNITEHDLFEKSVVDTVEFQASHTNCHKRYNSHALYSSHTLAHASLSRGEKINKDAILITGSGCNEVNVGTF